MRTHHPSPSICLSLTVAVLSVAMLAACGTAGSVANTPNPPSSPNSPTPPNAPNSPGPPSAPGSPPASPTPPSPPSSPVSPPITTTLVAETANNTSASNAFSAQVNGLPSPANVSKVDTRSLLYSGSSTKIYAGMLGWFGNPGHMDVGYRSDDPQQVRRQVEDMQSRGIQGAVLDWFGQTDTIVNGTAQALRAQAEAHPGFEFSIMEDAGALFEAAKANGCDVTTQIINDLNYFNAQFVPSPAYTRVDGRPVIFFFGVDAYYIDWNQVRTKVANNPLLIFRGVDGLARPISDGGFQWEDIDADAFHPASPNPFDPVLTAQDAFYQTNPSGRLAFGSVYRGFNDSLARWGIDRFVHPRCGQTWLDSFAEIGKFYSSGNQLQALQIVTWNDYDEGTAMEMGIDNCVYLQPGISGNTLSWTVGGGPESTVDHYTVFSSTDGKNLSKLADVPAGTHSLDLSPFNLTSGVASLYVKATGRPSIQNKMSPPIAFRAGDQPPGVNLVVTPTGPLAFRVSTAGSADPDGSIASSTIDFGDGTVVAGPNASHTYANVGLFDITATVVDDAGASAVAIQRVAAKAVASGVTIFSPSPSAVVNWPTPNFVASASSANPITRMNVLVDGIQIYATDQDTVNTALKIYGGAHHVEVQAVDSTGTVSSSAVDITAEPNDPAPVPDIHWIPFPQVGPNTVLLCGALWQDPNRFVNAFRWIFPDGSPDVFKPGVVHTFPTSGTFSITQSVINEFGTPGSVTQSINVTGAALTQPTVVVHVQDEQTQKQNLPIRLSRGGVAPK
jgi:hypothetical protein